MEQVEAKRKSVNNFEKIEEYMDFSGSPCFYKFALIVRNKDGKTPLVQKDALSGEMLVKEYFVDSKEYYDKVKPEMIALADMTRARIYMTLDRKSTYKVVISFLRKFTDMLEEFMLTQKATPKRLNKIIRHITSSIESSERGYKTMMFDVDCDDWRVLNAILTYVGELGVTPKIFTTVDGYHVIIPKKAYIANDWQERAIEYARKVDNYSEEVDNLIKEVKVQPNQLELVYFKGE